MPNVEVVATEAEHLADLARVLSASDAEALRMEGELIEVTDNGWSAGDPYDQPENPDPRNRP